MSSVVPRKEVIAQARRILAWASQGGNVRQVDDVILRPIDANEDEEDMRRVHLIPIGEAIGIAITKGREAPADEDIVFVSSHQIAAAYAALGFTGMAVTGLGIVPPVSAYPDYEPAPGDKP